MLKERMYVRCAVDIEYPDEPRDFILGKIAGINEFSETALIEFYDLIGIRMYYNIPESIDVPIMQLGHCKLETGAAVEYNGLHYHIAQAAAEENDGYYYYYLVSENNEVIKACETDIKASFNMGEISPLKQLKQYEFQNPVWYFGRASVNNAIHTIESAFYGFKELAGCKIFLKPYQLKTVMRCLSEEKCRYMIADEVGLGKTIEAASVIKIYLSDQKNKRVLICVPNALTEQWKTELAFKFHIFAGDAPNGNFIDILSLDKVTEVSFDYDFVVIDEVHSILKNKEIYDKALQLSRMASNVIMLSATPVQSRNEEYHKLLSLIQPEKYCSMSEEDFLALLELQNRIVRKVYSAVEYLSDYNEAIEDSENCHTDDTKDAFDELVDVLEDIADRTHDDVIKSDIDKLDHDADNFSMPQLQKIVAYICEAYQLERCVIRSRRKPEDTNIRELKELPYSMDSDFNNTESRIYSLLFDWISSGEFDEECIRNNIIPLANAFFSSSAAFAAAAERSRDIPEEIAVLARKWLMEDRDTVENIEKLLEDPENSMSRIIAVCDYLDQEAYDKKVLIFTHFRETHNLYRQILTNLIGNNSCAFFSEDMNADERELNAYRFQNDNDCRIMLSDESGGEGRNFQSADELICIDIPWSANTIEQRIGRLDRIGRDKSKTVVSVIVYAQDTVENDLANIWNKGLNIFTKSQSGLEIIMNEVDEQIMSAVAKDFKYGLSYMCDDMISEIQTLEKRVREERHFDIAAYQYQAVNRQIEKIAERYNATESELFFDSMMSWARLTGFKGDRVGDNVIRFNASSFSPRSAYNTLFVPPDMKAVIEDRLNKMQNHIRELSGDRDIRNDPNVIQGTFERCIAVNSDYLHFFAPGDDIFDSIVRNAVSSYKGRCSAVAVEAAFNWEGFVFNWFILPDELQLLENNVSLKAINQYRGFIPFGIVSTITAIDDTYDAEEITVKKEIERISHLSVSDIKTRIANFGKRSKKYDFLGIKEKYAISNLEWFKEKYPESTWNEKVAICYKTALTNAKEQLKKRFRIKSLSETLNKELSACRAASGYFGGDADIQKKQAVNDVILNAFKKPKLVLDSVCYIRMVKND